MIMLPEAKSVGAVWRMQKPSAKPKMDLENRVTDMIHEIGDSGTYQRISVSA